MKRLLLAILLVGNFLCTFGMHITGGEIIYQFISSNGSEKTYNITLRLFRDNNGGGAPLPTSVVMGIYDNSNNQLVEFRTVVSDDNQLVSVGPLPNCMTNPPNLNYSVAYYQFTISLPNNNSGYTISYQTCCRVNDISNVRSESNERSGATYIAAIPGTFQVNSFQGDNSPRFSQSIDVVCHNRPFTLDFSAIDADDDSLVYSFCDAYDGGGANTSNSPSVYSTPAGPPYDVVQYISGYSGSFPLGTSASINPNTGIISGIAPPAGKYVVSVCINAYSRTTRLLRATHRKDFIINVAPCDFAGAQLQPTYINCDGFTFNFTNLNTSPLNNTFLWDFGDGNTSTEASPTYTYTTAGIYTLKLVVNGGASCADSTTAELRVFPGFFPGFTDNTPTCKGVPVQFNDATTANYGTVNYWKWDFGVNTLSNDTSRLQNPGFAYAVPDTYNVTFIVGSDRGCRDTLVKTLSILDKAPYTKTNDTLICNIDTLQLNFVTPNPGNIVWSPNYMINDVNSFTPLVSPDVTTKYYVSYADNFGCTAIDSVLVSVVDRVSLAVINDTTICRTDTVKLNTISDGLSYTWSPALTLNDPAIQSPTATPTDPSTSYHVIARIGKCFTEDDVVVRTVPYPVADAGPDSTICFGNSIQLNASGGSIYSWSPRIFLSNSNIANPVSQAPQQDIAYIVTVRDVLGCPKPVSDTMFLTVAKIVADAGPADTNVVLGQPLLLNATGSTNYQWMPATWLNNPTIFNPVSLPQESIQYVVRVSNDQGCFDTDTINVKLFKIDPDLLVPTAFSPDNDGVNDIFRPIVIGMKSLDVFRVYNRWGQLMFSTTQVNNGWDGTFKGAPQSAGTFVWEAEGVTYLDRKVKKKGSVILIR
jgi:gliding motility-associated-like protein